MIKTLSKVNVVIYNISEASETGLPPQPYIPRESAVLVTGDVPAWKYGMALAALRKTPASIVAFRDVETGDFRVVLSGDFEYPPGTIVRI